MPGISSFAEKRFGSLVGNSAWSVGGNGLYAFCQWAMVMVMARAGTPGMVGQYAFALAISAPIFLFANLQIRAIQASDVKKEHAFGEYLGLRLLTTGAALLVILAMAAASGYEAGVVPVVLAISLTKAFEAISDVFHGDLQRRERMASVARYLSLKGLLSVVAVFLGIWFSHSVAVAALGVAAVFGGVLVFGERRFAVVQARPVWNWPGFGQLARLALPLGLVMMMISVIANMPRYFIEHNLGAQALGIFAALSYLGVAASTLVNAVGIAVMPRLARTFASGDPAFGRTLYLGSALATLPCLAGGAILAIAGKPVLTLLYGPVYALRVDVALWVMAAGALTCAASILGYGLTAARRFRPQVPLFLGVTLVAALGAFLLVPRFGLPGAAMSQVAAMAAQIAGSLVILQAPERRLEPAPVILAELAA